MHLKSIGIVTMLSGFVGFTAMAWQDPPCGDQIPTIVLESQCSITTTPCATVPNCSAQGLCDYCEGADLGMTQLTCNSALTTNCKRYLNCFGNEGCGLRQSAECEEIEPDVWVCQPNAVTEVKCGRNYCETIRP